jgi:cell division protein FtsW
MVRYRTDWILFSATLFLVFLGLVMVYSASSGAYVAFRTFEGGDPAIPASTWKPLGANLLIKQAIAAVVGLFLLMFLKRTDYRQFDRPVWALAPLGLCVPLLVAAYAVGRKHRWLHFGVADLQPSEFAKPALIVFLAWFVVQRLDDINHKDTLRPAAFAVLGIGLLVLAADFGTAVVLLLTAAAVFYVAGLERRYFGLATVLVGCVLIAAIIHKPYRLIRVIEFFDPSYTLITKLDPSGVIKDYARQHRKTNDDTRYQAEQSKIAVGSGGLLGLGVTEGNQKLLYLPEAHTDFIYAVIGEELGLVGTLGVLAAFTVILWRGFRLFWRAPDHFGRYLALGITVCLIAQVLINISVVLDLGPTKGIPLPLVSYGGSSMVSTLISLGMLLSVGDNA